MKKTLISIGSIIPLALPVLALAAAPKLDSYLGDLIDQATDLLGQLLIFLIALAVVWFIWNVVRYTMSEDEEKKGAAKGQMINGIIALTVIVSIWGIVAILRTAFGVDSTSGFPTGSGFNTGGSATPANNFNARDDETGRRLFDF